ncbi:AraC family transcriptional regulator [Saccharomonospora sp. NPDC046836]|uniref:AraC family transcriptional regulator n=1 Tax=Saccharomonospora sp. NPDC046836 TaxID=3156921 RepID=UPI00340513BE
MRRFFEHGDEFHWTDLDLAREKVAQSLCPHELSLIGPDACLDARLWSRRLQDIAINDISYGGDVHVTPGELDHFYVVMIPFSGSSIIRCGDNEVHSRPGLATVPNPTEWLTMRWSSDCAQRVVRVERPALDAHLRDLLGHSLPWPLRFHLGLDVTTGQGRSFSEEVELLSRRLERDNTTFRSSHRHNKADENLIKSTEQSLMTRLLLATNNNYRDLLLQDQPVTSSRVVRRTIELMHAHPEWAHTLVSLAREQGVSARTLERTFKRDTRLSPMAYLKGVRLDRAREMLFAASSEITTVGKIAHYLGFINRARFAADYRQRHGEFPSETLRK